MSPASLFYDILSFTHTQGKLEQKLGPWCEEGKEKDFFFKKKLFLSGEEEATSRTLDLQNLAAKDKNES